MDRKRVAIMGGTIGAAQAALTLAELGIEVNLITPDTALGLDELGGLAVALRLRLRTFGPSRSARRRTRWLRCIRART